LYVRIRILRTHQGGLRAKLDAYWQSPRPLAIVYVLLQCVRLSRVNTPTENVHYFIKPRPSSTDPSTANLPTIATLSEYKQFGSLTEASRVVRTESGICGCASEQPPICSERESSFANYFETSLDYLANDYPIIVDYRINCTVVRICDLSRRNLDEGDPVSSDPRGEQYKDKRIHLFPQAGLRQSVSGLQLADPCRSLAEE